MKLVLVQKTKEEILKDIEKNSKILKELMKNANNRN
jgi:hypothetical protein